MAIEIRPLSDEPDEITTIAGWLYDEWGERTGTPTVQPFIDSVRRCTDASRIPFAVAAYLDGRLAGTASIVEHDMAERTDLSPWLARVYVSADARHRGVGRAVCSDATRRARALGVRRLYLFTPDRERFYTYLGWRVVEHTQYWNRDVVIMSKEP